MDRYKDGYLRCGGLDGREKIRLSSTLSRSGWGGRKQDEPPVTGVYSGGLSCAGAALDPS